MNTIESLAIAGASLAGDAGVPGVGTAASALSQFRSACNQVIVNKKACSKLSNKAAILVDAISKHVSDVEDPELRSLVDEIDLQLRSVYDRVGKWSRYGLVKSFVKMNNISDGVDQCMTEVETMTIKYQTIAPMRMQIAQANADAKAQARHEEILDKTLETQSLVKQILRDNRHVQEAALLQSQGERAAEMIMGEGQQLLADSRRINARDDASRREVDQCRQGLVELQRLTGIPPSVKVLDGEVIRAGDGPAESGGHSHVWRGLWLGEIEVALKVLQDVRVSRRASKRFVKEIQIWSRLRHHNIQQLYGIVTDLGPQIHIVSPWRPDGDLLEYAISHPRVSKLPLLHGASGGLAYLHIEGIVHGNVRCSNILVTARGEAVICDFGTSKLIGDVTDTPTTMTLTRSGSTRWLAPELVFEDTTTVTEACDIWSFAMTILEFFTMREPWAEKRRDAHIITAMSRGLRPDRPQRVADLTDGVWGLISECWKQDPAARLKMSEVAIRLEYM